MIISNDYLLLLLRKQTPGGKKGGRTPIYCSSCLAHSRVDMPHFASRIRASIYSLFILAGRIMSYRICFVLYLIALVSCHFILSENPCLMYCAIYRTLVPPHFTQTVNNRVWVLSLALLSLYVCSLLCNWQVLVTFRPSRVGL